MDTSNRIQFDELDKRFLLDMFSIDYSKEDSIFRILRQSQDGKESYLRNKNGVIHFTSEFDAHAELNNISNWVNQHIGKLVSWDGMSVTLCGEQVSIAYKHKRTIYLWEHCESHVVQALKGVGSQLNTISQEIESHLTRLKNTLEASEKEHFTKFPDLKDKAEPIKVEVVCRGGMVIVDSAHINYGNIKGMYKTGDGHSVQLSPEVNGRKIELTSILNLIANKCYQLDDEILIALGIETHQPFEQK